MQIPCQQRVQRWRQFGSHCCRYLGIRGPHEANDLIESRFRCLFDASSMPHFLSLDDLSRVRVMLGNTPLELLHMPQLWRAFAPARCAAFAQALHRHLFRINPSLRCTESAHMCVLFRVSTRSYPRRAPQPFFYVERSKPLSLLLIPASTPPSSARR